MRRYAALALFLAFFCACTDDPQQDERDSVDSLRDTTGMGMHTVDTLKHDTGTGATGAVKYDCSVLRRRVPAQTQKAKIDRDLAELAHCGVDSFDFLYVVPNLFPRWAGSNQVNGNDTATYRDFVAHLNEFRMTEGYAQLHERVNTLDSLRSVPFDVKKLNTMKPVLGRLGFTQPEWDMFSGFARTWPEPGKSYTWGEVLTAFEIYGTPAPVN